LPSRVQRQPRSTMNRQIMSPAAVALLSLIAPAQVVYTHAPSGVSWPESSSGAATRVDSGQLTPDGIEDLVVLRGSDLWLLHAPAVGPGFHLVQSGCPDYAVLPSDSNGRSRVVASRSDGLWVCAWNTTTHKLLPASLLAAGPWCNATHLSAC